MSMFAITAQEFGENGRAWVENISTVLDVTIAKVGVLGLALLAVYQNLRSQAEVSKRLDRQGARIDQVALATVPTSQPANGAGTPASPTPKEAENPAGDTPALQPEKL